MGTLTDVETAFDYVVLVMNEAIGDLVGWPGYRTYDGAWNGGSYWQHIGYPGDLAGGQQPSFQGSCVISTTSSESLSGQTGFVLGHFNVTTPGHSGGPAWGWWGTEPWREWWAWRAPRRRSLGATRPVTTSSAAARP